MAWAKGRQAGYSPKQEYLKQHPNAVCKRVHYPYSGFETVYALYRDKGDSLPLLVRLTAEEAYRDALAGVKH
jgi:hypothetical protein